MKQNKIEERKAMTKKPEYHDHDEFQIRFRKIEELKSIGIDPYPHHFTPTASSKTLQEEFGGKQIGGSEEAASGATQEASLAGRLVLFRPMGKNIFAQIQDESGRFQIMFNRDLTSLTGLNKETQTEMSALKVLEKKLDIGDIIGVRGNLFYTQKGELTLFVKEATILCKTLLPLPEKHSGLHDKELRYRKRWLDLIANPEVKDTFLKRSQIFKTIRSFMDQNEFIEVETPILQSVYGGAEARPFVTKLNALDQEMFMRISLEIPLKKLIIGGIKRVFEIGKCFRNEGIDRSHNPEFTLMEAYASYWDYNDMMSFVEKLYEKIALEVHGTTKLRVQRYDTREEIDIDVKAPWIRLTMKESILKYGSIDVNKKSDEELKEMLLKSGHIDPKKLSTLSRGLLIQACFEVFVEPHLIQPHHIIDHPIETTVLCKPHRHPAHKEDGMIERFESFILGGEICNAYSELNDPVLQRTLLEGQQDRRDKGDEEAAPLDEEFIEAICQGMPPTAGVGIGLDRLVMLFTNSHSIRDVLYFPWMKPQS